MNWRDFYDPSFMSLPFSPSQFGIQRILWEKTHTTLIDNLSNIPTSLKHWRFTNYMEIFWPLNWINNISNLLAEKNIINRGNKNTFHTGPPVPQTFINNSPDKHQYFKMYISFSELKFTCSQGRMSFTWISYQNYFSIHKICKTQNIFRILL